MQQAGNMIDLKDQFALAAMAALLQRTSNSWPDYPDVATSAWHCAEFMMTERQKRIDLAALNEKRNNSDMRTLKLSTRLHYARLQKYDFLRNAGQNYWRIWKRSHHG